MSPEAAVLGLLSAARATPLAIVYALMLAPNPRRLVGGYVAAGLAISLVAGLVIVTTFDGTATSSESTTTRYAIDLALGIAALVYAAGYATGRFDRAGRTSGDGSGHGAGAGQSAGGRILQRLRTPTTSAAALAGAATNLPGLFYVAALVAILETAPGPVNGVFQVLVYNALRFAVPIAALLLVVLRPEDTRAVTERVLDWGRRHRRGLVVGGLGVVGVYLTVKGAAGLLA